jgi:ferrochelatase
MDENNKGEYDRGQHSRVGVLLTNLGTPSAPTAAAVRQFLREFLWDSRVVEIPRPVWWLILNGIVLNTRPRRSARAYAKIWTDEGSPLMVHTRSQAAALQQRLTQRHGENLLVDYAFRYGERSLPETVQSLLDRDVRKLLVLPLYPQYSGSTGGSTFDVIGSDFKRRRWMPELRFVNQYHDYAPYISALAHSIRDHWQTHGRADKLVLSYHGLPQRVVDLGDPYYKECQQTSRLLAEELGLDEEQYLSTFQSRFGAAKWLQPYTDESLKMLATGGSTSVQVVCPGFAADCLETLEEIAMENREVFIAAGGERYEYIAALNSGERHISMLADLVEENIQGWGLEAGATSETAGEGFRTDR